MLTENLIKLRKEHNLTKNQISTKLIISRAYYASWEKGLSEPNSTDIIKLCALYDISADDLLDIKAKKVTYINCVFINNSFNNFSNKNGNQDITLKN